MNWSYFHSTREHHELENNHAISRQNVAECQCQGRLTTEGDTNWVYWATRPVHQEAPRDFHKCHDMVDLSYKQ